MNQPLVFQSRVTSCHILSLYFSSSCTELPIDSKIVHIFSHFVLVNDAPFSLGSSATCQFDKFLFSLLISAQMLLSLSSCSTQPQDDLRVYLKLCSNLYIPLLKRMFYYIINVLFHIFLATRLGPLPVGTVFTYLCISSS